MSTTASAVLVHEVSITHDIRHGQGLSPPALAVAVRNLLVLALWLYISIPGQVAETGDVEGGHLKQDPAQGMRKQYP